MPIVQILGLPNDVADTPQLEELVLRVIPNVVAGIPELGLTSDQVTTFIQRDLLGARLGMDIIVIVTGLFVGPSKPSRTKEVRQALCEVLKGVMLCFALEYVPHCKLIEVFPQCLSDEEAFASWREKE